jgi:RimJ/RimL family protein N-acetyltransferase
MLKATEIRLAALTMADAPQLYAWINDREQVLFNAPYRPVSEPQHLEWLASITTRPDTVIFGIRTAKHDTLVGSCQLHSINRVHRTAELQIRIGETAARGKGYGKEAVQLLLDFAFSDLNLHRVFVHVFADNTPAIRLYESTGFKREGELREAAFIDGNYVDVLVMGVLESEHGG